MSNPQHFEEIWNKAEELAQQQLNTKDEIYLKIQESIKEYAKFDAIPSEEIKVILKTKKLGEVLFEIAKLTKLDNINSWAALDMEIKITEKSNQSDTSIVEEISQP